MKKYRVVIHDVWAVMSLYTYHYILYICAIDPCLYMR